MPETRSQSEDHFELKLELAKSSQEILDLKKENDRIYQQLDKYVTLARFTPLEKVVYGGVGIILIGVLTAVMSQIIA